MRSKEGVTSLEGALLVFYLSEIPGHMVFQKLDYCVNDSVVWEMMECCEWVIVWLTKYWRKSAESGAPLIWCITRYCPGYTQAYTSMIEGLACCGVVDAAFHCDVWKCEIGCECPSVSGQGLRSLGLTAFGRC